ncbi:MAG: ABC transporter permease, partial [Alphaproteobacteria bacterium]|nr:ABC transporter permease [Alphaproteobacteria bacterium]
MQQFRALLKKELGSYFNNFLAYIVLFFYLLTSIGSAFYFGSYLAMTDNSLFAAFYLQPFILTVIIPAITMKVWSDEYRLGTAEFLLTQPVDFYKF